MRGYLFFITEKCRIHAACGVSQTPIFNHSRKGTLYKTDQNYYFLWAMLFNITLEEIKINKACLFENIKKFFQIAQKVPNECTVEKFINMLSIKLK